MTDKKRLMANEAFNLSIFHRREMMNKNPFDIEFINNKLLNNSGQIRIQNQFNEFPSRIRR